MTTLPEVAVAMTIDDKPLFEFKGKAGLMAGLDYADNGGTCTVTDAKALWVGEGEALVRLFALALNELRVGLPDVWREVMAFHARDVAVNTPSAFTKNDTVEIELERDKEEES